MAYRNSKFIGMIVQQIACHLPTLGMFMFNFEPDNKCFDFSFNQLDLPVYETYDKLRSYLLKAIHECSEGFGFA